MNTDTKTTEVIDLQPKVAQPLALIQGGREVSAVERAVDAMLRRPDVNIDQMQQFLQIMERQEERQAERAFVEAMAEFKLNAPQIVKDKEVVMKTQKGTVRYWHATLKAVCDAAIEGLARVGISHRWDPRQEGAKIGVTCVLTHRMGHSQNTYIEATADTSGTKNSIQSIASTITYLQRYTLLAATGLATGEESADDDGASHADEFPQWAYDIQIQLEAAEDFANLKAIRNAAAQRCQKEGAQREWNELVNPTFKRVAEKAGWIQVAEIAGA